jgi:hypothetical protein
MTTLTFILAALALYLVVGLVFACAFVTRGVQRIDPAAIGAPWSFRILILPGSAALWPWLLRRWMRGQGPPPPADSREPRIENTRRTLLGPRAWWAAILFAWFVFEVIRRPPGGAP